MKYPAVYMMGPKAHGEILSIAFAGKGSIVTPHARRPRRFLYPY